MRGHGRDRILGLLEVLRLLLLKFIAVVILLTEVTIFLFLVLVSPLKVHLHHFIFFHDIFIFNSILIVPVKTIAATALGSLL